MEPRSESIALGVLLEGETREGATGRCAWRVLGLLPGAAPVRKPRLLREGGEHVRYHAATLALELHRRETQGYLYNLGSGVPSIFVVLRDDETAPDGRPAPFHVTACPLEAQGYLDSSEEVVERVPMPDVVREWVESFVARHHREEPSLKGKRARARTVAFARRPPALLRQARTR